MADTTTYRQTGTGAIVTTTDPAVIGSVAHAAHSVGATVWLTYDATTTTIIVSGGKGRTTAPVPGGVVAVGVL